jgi:glycosyltransferase involved in cell wall biosynthesis
VEPYAFFTFFVSWILRARYVITIHGSFGVKSFYNSLYKLIQIFSYENAYKIICISNYTKNRVTQYVKLNNIEIIPNGIDIKQFNSLEELTQTKEDTILGVGGLKERKGFDIVIKAVNLVKKDIPGIKYYIVGTQEDKKYFSYLSGLIKKNGLEDNISFLKEISDSKLKELYRRSKILVLTPVSSKYNFEGFGLTYLEANASGLPVIGSYDNGGEDAIKYGYNGFLTKPRDERDIAEKIVTLLKNDGLYSNMVKNSEKWAKSFLWKDIVKKYINMYEKSNSTR